MARDPVCGMEIEEAQAADTAEYEGRTYYFCSVNCADEFREGPARYVP